MHSLLSLDEIIVEQEVISREIPREDKLRGGHQAQTAGTMEGTELEG